VAETLATSSFEGENLINGTSNLEGLQCLGTKISFYSIFEWNTWNCNTGNGRDKSTVMSFGNMELLNCFALRDQVLWLDMR